MVTEPSCPEPPGETFHLLGKEMAKGVWNVALEVLWDPQLSWQASCTQEVLVRASTVCCVSKVWAGPHSQGPVLLLQAPGQTQCFSQPA